MTQTAITATQTETKPDPTYDDGFPLLLDSVRGRFAAATSDGSPLFTTDVGDLFALFLDNIPQTMRQHYTCNACRHFLNRFGALVTIGSDGRTAPAMWDLSRPVPFMPAVQALVDAIGKAKVTGVYLSSERMWGTPVTGPWNHFAVEQPQARIFPHSLVKTAGQAMAEKLEEYAMLRRGLGEFTRDQVHTAHGYLTSDNLYRSEKCIGVAKWLLDLHDALAATKNKRAQDHIVWRAVASAPAGFCHVRSGVIGTLLEDIAAELPFAEIKRRFDEKMDPLKYQRPIAPPSAGNIARAEKIMAELRTAGSLERRFARLVDVIKLWEPQCGEPAKPAEGGVFSHLKPGAKPSTAKDMPGTVMTWEKFRRTVLPHAESIEHEIQPGRRNYAAFVTARNPEAPPILQWDRADLRNPVSWYLYSGGSDPSRWNLPSFGFHEVTALVLQPNIWHEPERFTHQGQGVLFCLRGARDTSHRTGGGFFVESLRSEYHEIRSTLEAYANSARIDGRDEAEVCGILIQKVTAQHNYKFRVTSKGTRTIYTIDRWD